MGCMCVFGVCVYVACARMCVSVVCVHVCACVWGDVCMCSCNCGASDSYPVPVCVSLQSLLFDHIESKLAQLGGQLTSLGCEDPTG